MKNILRLFVICCGIGIQSTFAQATLTLKGTTCLHLDHASLKIGSVILKDTTCLNNNSGQMTMTCLEMYAPAKYQSHGTDRFVADSYDTARIVGNTNIDSSYFGSLIQASINPLRIGVSFTTDSLCWENNSPIHIDSGKTIHIKKGLEGYDTTSACIYLHADAILERTDHGLPFVDFPIGSDGGVNRRVILVPQVINTQQQRIRVMIRDILGSDYYQETIDSVTITSSGCSAGGFDDHNITLSCIEPKGWSIDAPAQYQYVVYGRSYETTCPNEIQRIIIVDSVHWSDAMTHVVGSFQESLCNFTDWIGNAPEIPGGVYAGAHTFGIARGSRTLPVTWLTFTVDDIDNRYLQLYWTTATEVNNAGFFIEKSIDAVTFTQIGFVSGAGTITVPQNYRFDDTDVDPEITYYYRLRQVDHDGHVQYSSVRQGMIHQQNLSGSIWVSPNPTYDDIVVAMNNFPGNTSAGVALYSTTGNLVGVWTMDALQTLRISTRDFAQGWYVLVVTTSLGEVVTQKIIKN